MNPMLKIALHCISHVHGHRQPWARGGACPPLENENVILLRIYIENVYDFHRKKWSAHPWKYGLPTPKNISGDAHAHVR